MLHRERGVRPREAWFEWDAWEVDLLVSGLKQDAAEMAKQERAARAEERRRG